MIAGSDLAAELNDLIRQFENSKNELTDLLSGVSENQFNKRPDSGGWSIGECVDHLVITGKDYTRQIENGLRKAIQKRYIIKSP